MISGLLGNIWKGIAALAAAAAGVLYALYRITEARRQNAETKAQNAKKKAEAQKTLRKVERDVDRAVKQARKHAKREEQTLDELSRKGKRRKTFGDPRLKRGKGDGS